MSPIGFRNLRQICLDQRYYYNEWKKNIDTANFWWFSFMYLLFEIMIKVKTFSYSKFHSQLHCQYFDSTYAPTATPHPYHFDPCTGWGLLCCIISIHKNKSSFTKYTKCNNVHQVHIYTFFIIGMVWSVCGSLRNLDHHCSFHVGGAYF